MEIYVNSVHAYLMVSSVKKTKEVVTSPLKEHAMLQCDVKSKQEITKDSIQGNLLIIYALKQPMPINSEEFKVKGKFTCLLANERHFGQCFCTV